MVSAFSFFVCIYSFNSFNKKVFSQDVIFQYSRMSILTLAGATLFTDVDIDKQSLQIDLVLTDSICLPPHVTAVTPKIAKVLNKVALTSNAQIVDMSWVTQCIVRKKRIEISDQYKIQSIYQSYERLVNISSIKVEQCGNLVRYEIGDSIKFGKAKSKLSYGRITALQLDVRQRKKWIEVKILELHNDCELMDGGKNMSTIKIEENELKGHTLILGGKDYEEVKWSRNGTVFMQKKASK